MASSEPVSLAACVMLGALAWLLSRPRREEATRDLRFVAILGLVLFAFQALRFGGTAPAIDVEGARSASRSLARIAGGYGAARAFYAVLGVSRIRDALARFAGPLSRTGIDLVEPLALVIAFVPAVLSVWRSTEEAARARGFGPRLSVIGGQSLRRSMRMLSAVIAAFLRGLLLLARDVAEARGARRTGAARRSLPPFSATPSDFFLVVFGALPLILAFLF
ncbi:MAG: hypothetical protein JXA15_02155 [Spirochaetales bacterium]|nr:hypothetical protein [Spirochaetales bacterium]